MNLKEEKPLHTSCNKTIWKLTFIHMAIIYTDQTAILIENQFNLAEFIGLIVYNIQYTVYVFKIFEKNYNKKSWNLKINLK